MKKYLKKITMLFLFIFFSCSAQKNLKLGSKMDENKQISSKILIPSGSLIDSFSAKYNNNTFIFGVNKDETVVFISTVDPVFEIEGFKINDDISKIFDGTQVNYIAGWGYYLKINSEWFAGFDFNTKPTKNTKIQWFFKYKFSEGNNKLFKE